MLNRLLLAGSLIAAGLITATAQTTPPPPAAAPGATVAPPITDATHCRDANGVVRLKVGGTGAPATTGSASNTVPSSSQLHRQQHVQLAGFQRGGSQPVSLLILVSIKKEPADAMTAALSVPSRNPRKKPGCHRGSVSGIEEGRGRPHK